MGSYPVPKLAYIKDRAKILSLFGNVEQHFGINDFATVKAIEEFAVGEVR
jgi:hypothetical protein